MSHTHFQPRRSLWRTWQGLCIIGLAAAMIFFLFTEHTAHTLGALPFVIFLLCPILHLFMHKGHGGHGGHSGHTDRSTEAEGDGRLSTGNRPGATEQPRREHEHGGHH